MACQKLQVLGNGTYGTVFLAQYSSSLFTVPAKLVVKSSGIESLSFDSGRVEARILRELRGCPYIIQCVGEDISVEHGNTVYNFLLEYAPGRTLRSLIKSCGGLIPECSVSFYAYQLLKGILDVHRRGFVHCDLRPSNVLLFPRGGGGVNFLKIANFGLAKVAGKDICGDSHGGAFLYTSPESMFCSMHEAPKDIWAIGCMVAEMLAGKSPWRSTNLNDYHEFALELAFNQPEIPQAASDNAKDFLKRCLDRNPNARWTADMLLSHPFVDNVYNRVICQTWEDHQALTNRVFDLGEWLSTHGLFSTPIPSFNLVNCWRRSTKYLQ